MSKRLASCVVILVLGLLSTAAYSQQEQLKRTFLQKAEFPGSQYVTTTGIAEVVPSGVIPRHTHPGLEMGYVLEGECAMSIGGNPDLHLKAGDSFQIGPNVPHSGVNLSKEKPLKILSTWVVEKDKPLAIPAPK